MTMTSTITAAAAAPTTTAASYDLRSGNRVVIIW